MVAGRTWGFIVSTGGGFVAAVAGAAGGADAGANVVCDETGVKTVISSSRAPARTLVKPMLKSCGPVVLVLCLQ